MIAKSLLPFQTQFVAVSTSFIILSMITMTIKIKALRNLPNGFGHNVDHGMRKHFSNNLFDKF